MNTQHSVTHVARRPDPARKAIINALEGFRREWQETAGGADLVEVMVPVGLVIGDLSERLGLTNQERLAILGSKLYGSVSGLLEERIQLKP